MHSADNLASERMTGFPATDATLVSLATWQDEENVRWAFQHMREIIPTQAILADPSRIRPLDAKRDDSVYEADVTRLGGITATASEVFADTWTDALVVVHDGKVADERYESGMTSATPHLLMSVSKSIVGCVAGILSDQGLVDPAADVTRYVPEVKGSGYDGARVRDVLDMRTGVAFSESYEEPESEVRVMERSMGWRPIEDGDPAGMYE